MSERIETLLLQLQELADADRGPFPYEGSRQIAAKYGDATFGALIPDLDYYFSTIAGYMISGRRILKWPTEKIEKAQQELSESLGDRHPSYRALESLRREEAPGLVDRLAHMERARLTLLELLRELRAPQVR